MPSPHLASQITIAAQRDIASISLRPGRQNPLDSRPAMSSANPASTTPPAAAAEAGNAAADRSSPAASASPISQNKSSAARYESDNGTVEPSPKSSSAAAHMPRVASTASNLPPLPSDDSELFSQSGADTTKSQDDESSLLNDNNHNETSAFLGDVRSKLMDIESSFMPDGSPSAHQSAKAGADDTYLFGGSPGRTQHLSKTPAIFEEGAPEDRTKSADETDTSMMSTLQSSPVAAAMRRNLDRAALSSGRKPSGHDNYLQFDAANSQKLTDTNGEEDIRARTLSPDQGFDRSNSKALSSRASRRPPFLQHRQSSTRSSVSSVIAPSDASDNTVGADYALQSGGAAPDSERNGLSLSRMPSLSNLSSLKSSSHSDTMPEWGRTRSSTSGTAQLDKALGRLEEEEPTTPRPGSHGTIAPSDTVIARHIQDIHVPETVAREYRAKHSNTRSPERRQAIGMSYSARSKNNLTLKEQNGKIDKLTKENFDLKMKIHFLDQALQNRSDEGMNEMITKNVQLQTDLAKERKEHQSARRKIRELERKLKAHEETEQKAGEAPEKESDFGDEEKAELEEEVTYLKETLKTVETEIRRLQQENMTKESEKRRLAEYVKTMTESRSNEPATPLEETNEMWKDLLRAETARREAADEDAERLREELRRLKTEQSQTTHNVRNVYNISKRHQNTTYAQSEAGQSEAPVSERNGADSAASTLVDQLKHENAELRRDLSAQTSMLTSRNRERERLQQEIEDLKIQHRRGGLEGGARSIAGDSIFDRSVSRAHQRSSSRASGTTRVTQASDQERDELDKKLGALRDELAQVKMLNQDLEKALNEHLDTVEALEDQNQQLREECGLAIEDLQSLQTERDDLIDSIQNKDEGFDKLRAQAVETIDKLEEELDQKDADFNTLQEELKSVSESVVRLEDELNASHRKEESLEQQTEDLEQEIENLEQKVRDTTSKNERLDVQLENSQNEIAFLREEQESDKIKIGDLEASLATAETRIEDMISQASQERRQRDALDSREKAEIQTVMDELNQQSTAHKDEIRKLRKKLADKEKEAETWKERLESLESNLLEALGDLNGTRSSILKDVTKLQRDYEHTLSALEVSQQDLSDKDHTLRARDALLESAGLETKKLSELLDKERTARRSDRATFDAMQRSQQSLTRTIQQNDTRVSDVETARHADKRKFLQLEGQLKEQLTERNVLLFSLWTRVATLCGRDFVRKHPLGGDATTTSDFVAKNLSAFSKHVSFTLKTLEKFMQSTMSQIRDLERTFNKDFAGLERALDLRTKRIDHLEKTMDTVRIPAPVEPSADTKTSNRSSKDTETLRRLREENKMLKTEVLVLRTTTTNTSPSKVPERNSSTRESRSMRSRRDREGTPHESAPQLSRHFSTSAVDTRSPRLSPSPSHRDQGAPSPVAEDPTVTVPAPSHIPIFPDHPHGHHPHTGVTHSRNSSESTTDQQGGSQQRWVHRLKELERRLKAERSTLR